MNTSKGLAIRAETDIADNPDIITISSFNRFDFFAIAVPEFQAFAIARSYCLTIRTDTDTAIVSLNDL